MYKPYPHVVLGARHVLVMVVRQWGLAQEGLLAVDKITARARHNPQQLAG